MKNLMIIIAAALFLIIQSGPAAAQEGDERMFDPDTGNWSDFFPPMPGLLPGGTSPIDWFDDPAERPPWSSPTDWLFLDDPAERPPMFGLDPGRPLGIGDWMFAQLDAILHGTEPDQPTMVWPGDESERRGAFFSVFDYMDAWFTTPLSEFRNAFPAPDARGVNYGRFLERSGDSSTRSSVNIFLNPDGQLQIDSHESGWGDREESGEY